MFYGRTSISPSVGVSGFDIIDLRLAWRRDNERVIMARSGQRRTLKEYLFLSNL